MKNFRHFLMMFVFFGFVACAGGGNSESEKSECSDSTKVEDKCCAGEKPDCPSKGDTTHAHDHSDTTHSHDHSDADANNDATDNQ